MAKNKMSAPKKSGNSTSDTPIIAMNLDGFLIEVASNSEEGDKNLRTIAKEIQKRYNAHDDLRDAVEHVLLVSEDGEMDDLDFIMLRDALKKSK